MQKLAKRRAFVWGEGVSTVFAKQASKKKKKNGAAPRLRASLRWALPQIDLSSIERRRAYVAKGCGEQVHRMPCEGRQHMVQRKEGSGGVLRSVDDTCHGSRSMQNRILAFLVLRTSGTTPSRQPHQSGRSHHCCRRSFRPGDVRLVVQRLYCYQHAAVQSGRRHCEIRSMRQQFIPLRRTWVLTRSDCSPATCAPPAVHDSAGKISTLLLDVKHTRTQYDSLTTQGTYQRSRDRLSRK